MGRKSFSEMVQEAWKKYQSDYNEAIKDTRLKHEKDARTLFMRYFGREPEEINDLEVKIEGYRFLLVYGDRGEWHYFSLIRRCPHCGKDVPYGYIQDYETLARLEREPLGLCESCGKAEHKSWGKRLVDLLDERYGNYSDYPWED